MTKPSVVIEKDSYDKETDTFKPLHVYGKSFYRIGSGNKRVVESVLVFKDENNIVIGSHNNDIDNFVKQIKTADQIIYADPEISRMITHLNEEMGNRVSLYGMNTEALNPKYDKNLDMSSIEHAQKLDNESMPIYSYQPFGYEGSLVNVEVELRHGIPSVDIVGLADDAVKETWERTRAAINNAGFEYPPKRVLVSLAPADLKKNGRGHDLAIATAIISAEKDIKGEPVLVMGELELSGHIRPVIGMRPAVRTALAAGITKVVCHPNNAKEIRDIEGITVCPVEYLSQIWHIKEPSMFITMDDSKLKEIHKAPQNVLFDNSPIVNIDNNYLQGYSKTCDAIEAAVAGKHNLLLSGPEGCGKNLLANELIPALTPLLTYDEAQIPSRIKSLAGLSNLNNPVQYAAPFRYPQQTASLEGMVGGGEKLRPGEVSLAHNGSLVLQDAHEFRSSVLQLLRVPAENGVITLSRAGRTTTFPAKFQLISTSQPCACGQGGNPGHVCLCSNSSKKNFDAKIAPIVNISAVKSYVYKDPADKKKVSIDDMKKRIETAYKIQRKNGVYNAHLSPEEIKQRIDFTPEMNNLIAESFENKDSYGKREILDAMRLSVTVANMDGREQVTLKDLKKAIELGKSIDEQTIKLNQKINKKLEKSYEITR